MQSEPGVRQCGLFTRLLRVRPLAAFALCVMTGALTAQRYSLPLIALCAAAGGLLLLWIALKLMGGKRLTAIIAAAGVFLGAAALTWRQDARPILENRYGVEFSGVMGGTMQVDEDEGRLVCVLSDVEVYGEKLGRDVRLYLRGDPGELRELEVGQRIAATGHIWGAKKATNPWQFDFGAYLWRSGLAGYATANMEDAAFSPAEASFGRMIWFIRRAISEKIEALFPKNAPLAKALILGDRTEMGDEALEEFRLAGAAHLLAISGMHVSVLAMLLAWSLGRVLPRKVSFYLTLAMLVLYCAIVGFRPSMLRATAMYAILGYAPLAGRPSDPLTRLSAAFLILYFCHPLSIGDAGFGMSFLASAGILLLREPLCGLLGISRLEARCRTLPRCLRGPARYALGLLSATMAAQIATLPLVLANYGSVPLLATISNLAAVPLTLGAYAVGLAATLLSFVAPFLAAPVGWVSDMLLSLLSGLVGACAKLPLNSLSLAAPPMWLGAVFGALMLLCSGVSAIPAKKRRWLLLTLRACIAFSTLLAFLGTLGFKVVFLDVGQGDGAVVYAQGNVYMIDTGRTETPADDYLRGSGARLEAVFLTHPHEDHAGGLTAVLGVARPETIYIPAGWDDVTDADDGILEAVEAAREMGIEIVTLSAGDVVALSEDVTATVLHPSAEPWCVSGNELSMVLYLEYGDGSALFTGDLPKSAEPRPLPQADLLKVAHHGAKGSTSMWMAGETMPAAAVISVGRNSYGHPAESTMALLEETGAEIYRTDQRGAVTVRIFKGGRMIVRTEVSP